NDMITVRAIGYQEKAPKIRIVGRRKSSVAPPPLRAHVRGVRRLRRCACLVARLLTRTGSLPSTTASIAGTSGRETTDSAPDRSAIGQVACEIALCAAVFAAFSSAAISAFWLVITAST